MKLTASPAPVDPRTDMGSVENYLSPATWGWVSKTLEDRTDTPEGARDFWLMMLLYHTGIRREEAAAATVSDIIPDRMTGVPRLKVNGKGGKLRFVTLTETCVRAPDRASARQRREPCLAPLCRYDDRGDKKETLAGRACRIPSRNQSHDHTLDAAHQCNPPPGRRCQPDIHSRRTRPRVH